MTSKTLGAVFTSLMFAGVAAFAQDQSTTGQTGQQQHPYTSGQTQQQPYTTGQQQQPYTTGQQQPYTTGQAGTMDQPRQYTGTVTSLQPNNQITVQTPDGKKHKFSLSSTANTTVSPNVATGISVMVTETTDASGRKAVTITPAGPTGAAGTTGTTGQPGQTQY